MIFLTKEIWQMIYHIIFETAVLNIVIFFIVNFIIDIILQQIIFEIDYIRFPRLVGYFDIYMIFYALYRGFTYSVLRLCLLYIGCFISVLRIDQSVFPEWIVKISNLDSLNNSYLSVILMYHISNNPCVDTMIFYLDSFNKKKEYVEKFSIDNYFKKKIYLLRLLHHNEILKEARKKIKTLKV